MDYKSSFTEMGRLYDSVLQSLGGFNLTRREVDVIACTLHNRGEKKTAAIMHISPRTVNTHIYNIMNKIGCNSRERIIDYVEKNGGSNHYRRYYFCLQIYAEFQSFMLKIGSKSKGRVIIIAKRYRISELYKQARDDLAKAGIKIEHDIDSDENTDLSTKTKDYSIWYEDLTKDNYYEQLISLIKDIYDPLSTSEMIAEFEGGAKNIFTQMQGVDVVNIRHRILGEDKNTPIRLNLGNIILIIMGVLIIATFCYQYIKPNVTPSIESEILTEDSPKIKRLNQQFAELATKVSANNVVKKYAKLNHSNIKLLEHQIEALKALEVQKYFYGKKVTAEELANCLYNLNSLTAYQLYIERDGDKARQGLFLAKKLAEHFVISRSKVEFNIEEMPPSDIFKEFQVTHHLSEIYTLTTYLLGRSYLYQGDFKQAEPYLKIANYFGEKLNMFEGYLARFQGLNRIRERKILDLLDNKEFNKANNLIKELIESYEIELINEKTYLTNINHLMPEFTIKLTPHKDKLNRVICLKQIIKFCAQLLIIDEDPSIRKQYLAKIIEYLSGADGVLKLIYAKEVVSKHRIVALNCLGEILMGLEYHEISCHQLYDLIAKNLDIAYSDRLSFIESIYELALNMSRNGEYTKSDAFIGMVRLLELKMRMEDLTEEKQKIILQRKSIYQEKANKLNLKLKHRHQDRLIYKE